MGHGQGVEVNIISPSLADLSVNLAGILIKFLIERHLEFLNRKESAVSDEDVPF